MARSWVDIEVTVMAVRYTVDVTVKGGALIVDHIYEKNTGMEIHWNDNVSLGEMIEAEIMEKYWPFDD